MNIDKHLQDLLHYLDMGITFEEALRIISYQIARDEEAALEEYYFEKYRHTI